MSSSLNGTVISEHSVDLLFDGLTLELLISKLIGYSVVVFSSLFVRLPQLVILFRAKNAEGISYIGELLLLLASCNSACYNLLRGYPLSTWGEGVTLGVQELVAGWCILSYTGRGSLARVHVIGVLVYVLLLLSPLIPLSFHVLLQVLGVPMVASSKLIQIRTNWSRHSTGHLSTASSVAMTLRTAGRLATSLIETGDIYLIVRYAIITVLNAVLFTQIVYYSRYSGKRATDKSI